MEIAGQDQTNLEDTLNKFMEDNLDMSFTNDVVPWVGRYASLAITDADFQTGEIHYLAIIQTRNSGKARQFLADFAKALEDNEGISLICSERDGILFYTYSGQEFSGSDQVIALAGKFVYLAESEQAILDSFKMNKSNSLSSSKAYKDAIAVLPKNRLLTLYFGGEAYASILNQILAESYLDTSVLPDLENLTFGGMAMSLSTQDAGLRVDTAVSYDEAKLSDFQKQSLQARYLDSTIDGLVPGNTFFFMGTNSSLTPGRYLQDGSPLYNKDIKDALDLLDQELNINIADLLNLLGGEIGLAVAPSNDTFLSEGFGPQVGLMVLSSTPDEEGANAWLADLNNILSEQMQVDFSVDDASIGDYNLQKLSMSDGVQQTPFLFYGADKGYFILGMSEDMLNKGLNSTDTLANNIDYRNTWKAFPKGGTPLLYLNTSGLIDMLTNMEGGTDLDVNTLTSLKKIPTIALSINTPKGFTQSSTLIVFIEPGE